jgi:hypothetical protein
VNRGARIAALIRVSLVGCLLAFLCTATSADEVIYDLRVERGHVPASMRLIRVKQGDTVRLRWSSDRTMILHLHGYDIERKVGPGAATEMRFTARATGRFPVSVHKPQQDGGHTHDPPLVHVEVYPR